MVSTREEYDDLFGLYLPVGIAVAVLIFGVFLFALIRYRRRGDGSMPSQETPLHWLEGVWALAIAATVGVLLTFNFNTEANVDEVNADPGLEVDVTAFQWGWRFTYPASGVSVVGDNLEPPTLTVPTDTTVRFEVSSRDVIHAFWIPELRFKKDVFPDRTNEFDLTFSAGAMQGRCAEFCGLRHANMLFDVQAVPPDEFDAWIATKEREQKGKALPQPSEGGEL